MARDSDQMADGFYDAPNQFVLPVKPSYFEKPLDGVGLIEDERKRQLTTEGFLPSHDQQYAKQELIRAAQSYLMAAEFIEQFPEKKTANMTQPGWWPWDAKWWKPSSDPIRNLTKAGALIAAEIDRLQASAATTESK